MVRANRASRLLRIRVQDIDDNQPVFAPYTPVGFCDFWGLKAVFCYTRNFLARKLTSNSKKKTLVT
jgi:hypothetical protein